MTAPTGPVPSLIPVPPRSTPPLPQCAPPHPPVPRAAALVPASPAVRTHHHSPTPARVHHPPPSTAPIPLTRSPVPPAHWTPRRACARSSTPPALPDTA